MLEILGIFYRPCVNGRVPENNISNTNINSHVNFIEVHNTNIIQQHSANKSDLSNGAEVVRQENIVDGNVNTMVEPNNRTQVNDN